MIHSLYRLLTPLGGSSRQAAARRRRPAAPRIEFLETRLTPSTIAGVVYNDLPNTGLYQSGDPLYANIPINLANASGTVIASTTTDANGHYAFTIDPSINTSPATQQQTASFGPSATDTPQALQIAQFDPSLGTLTSVQIQETGTIASQLQVDNLDAIASTVQANIQGAITLQGAGLTNPLTANVQTQESASVAATDGTVGFTGASAYNFGVKDAQGTQSVTLDASSSDLSAFIGTGQLTMNAGGTADVNASGPADLLAMIQSTVSGQVKVVYTYTPSNALKPGQYTVIETQDPPNTLPGTDSSNGVPVAIGTPADTIPVTLPPGGDSVQNNFGKLTTAKVSGYVYLDNNGDGQFNLGDSPIASCGGEHQPAERRRLDDARGLDDDGVGRVVRVHGPGGDVHDHAGGAVRPDQRRGQHRQSRRLLGSGRPDHVPAGRRRRRQLRLRLRVVAGHPDAAVGGPAVDPDADAPTGDPAGDAAAGGADADQVRLPRQHGVGRGFLRGRLELADKMWQQVCNLLEFGKLETCRIPTSCREAVATFWSASSKRPLRPRPTPGGATCGGASLASSTSSAARRGTGISERAFGAGGQNVATSLQLVGIRQVGNLPPPFGPPARAPSHRRGGVYRRCKVDGGVGEGKCVSEGVRPVPPRPTMTKDDGGRNQDGPVAFRKRAKHDPSTTPLGGGPGRRAGVAGRRPRRRPLVGREAAARRSGG